MADVPFPLAGLNEYNALTRGRVFDGKSSAASTQSVMNCRSFDTATGRARGGVRPGLTKFDNSQVNGSEPIQDIITVVNAVQSSQSFLSQIAINIETDPAGSASNGTGILTSDGAQQASAAILSKTDVMGPTCWDDYGYFYSIWLSDADNGFKISKRISSTNVAQWTTSAFSATTSSATSQTFIPLGLGVKPSVRNSAGVSTIDGTVYAYVRTSGANNYEIWRFNSETGANLDAGAAWKTEALGQITGIAQHSSGTGFIDNCLAVSGSYLAILECVNNSDGYVRIFTTGGAAAARTQVFGPAGGGTQSFCINLVGDGTGNFFWSGFQGGTGGKVGKITFAGTVTTASASYTMAAYSPTYKQLQTMDSLGRIVWLTDSLSVVKSGYVTTATGTVGPFSACYSTPTGGVVVSYLTGTRDAKIAMTDNNGYVVANSTGGEFHTTYANIKNRFISVNQYLPQSADQLAYYRSATHLFTAGGTVKKYKGGAISSVTGGTEIVAKAPKVIYSAQVDSNVYFADGSTAQYYNATTDTMIPWVATSGDLPIDNTGSRPTLICAWRKRILLSGLKQLGNYVYGSAQGAPLNFNYTPENVTAETAFFEPFPDVVNCLLPYNDDICIVGCDHSIYKFSGDPQDGGGIDVISNTVGMAYGRPCCQSVDGTVFFVGSRGGVYMMSPNSPPISITNKLLHDRFARFDLSTNIARMVWDDREQGFYLFLSPTDGTTDTNHYFYDARTGSWWPINFGDRDYNGRVLYVIDGADPDDRVTVIGCNDGYVRKFDATATTDDGTAISSYVYFGPFLNSGIGELQIETANASQSVTVSCHIGTSAENAIAAAACWTGIFAAGRSKAQSPRRYGRALYLKLAATGYWSLERMQAGITVGSAKRHRRQ